MSRPNMSRKVYLQIFIVTELVLAVDSSLPDRLPGSSSSSQGSQEVSVWNLCPERATVTTREWLGFGEAGTRIQTKGIDTLEYKTFDCMNGLVFEATLSHKSHHTVTNCTAHSNPITCAYHDGRTPTIKIECPDDDAGSKANVLCGALEIHERCTTYGTAEEDDLASFCPARSIPVSKYDLHGDACSIDNNLPIDGVHPKFRCPVCGCTQYNRCEGPDCGHCDNFVSRSTRTACVPNSWATPKPSQKPTPHPSPSPVSAANDDDGATFAPTIFSKGAARRAKQASNMAAFIIACLAAGIAACAIRQALAKQRRLHNPRAGLYVDIPSEVDVHTFSQHQGPAPGLGSMNAIEMHVHGDPSL